MATTALGAALEKNGLSQMINDLDLAIAKFQNLGGSREVAIARIERAYGRTENEEGGGRERKAAEGGQIDFAPASSGDGVGQSGGADKAALVVPTPSPTERSAGQKTITPQVLRTSPVAASPSPPSRDKHKPGHSTRGMAVIAATNTGLAKALFSTRKLIDGRLMSDVRWSEAPMLAQRSAQDARILLAAHRYATPPDPSWTLGQCVPEADQRRIISAVEEMNAL